MNTHIVIMAGGVGSRLWPISTPENPKQFIDVLGIGKSLIQLTVERFSSLCPMSNFWVVTSDKYQKIVKEQLPGIADDHILCEPMARNTAPCIAYACWKIAQKYPDANIVVTPSDALVINTEAFTKVVKTALDFTEKSSSIVTVGVMPNRPETGYGYINVDSYELDTVTKVKAFKEKPNLETAKTYLAAGGYFWNAGIFVWSVKTINDQLRRFVPQIAGVMDELSKYFYTEDEEQRLKELFPTCDKVSIDYAVMEKSEDIYVIPADLGWSDLGSWGSVSSYTPDVEGGNKVVGDDVRLFDCKNCVVHAADSKTVVVSGLDGYIVAEGNNSILICRQSDEQLVKEYLNNK